MIVALQARHVKGGVRKKFAFLLKRIDRRRDG